ncbi:DUF6378 domain-containing protein [Roseococcus pinisoli]|uniref:DUF6378 domain-containing protein n=1 Tax=Roseococcus pinisoli TaxID=2835040 RepID=A0ABS5QF69_9PROT|nr:DUF6378 domain-containing protein [Roseococcus pinisoli]MBS7812316.1 hypothetical protein [Roseococcus pinisoli]
MSSGLTAAENDHFVDMEVHMTQNSDVAEDARPAEPPGFGNRNMPPRHVSGTVAAEFLLQAAELVKGVRNITHGEKEASFSATASVWNAYLGARRDPARQISSGDVAILMVLQNFVQAEHGMFSRERALNAVGYASIWAELLTPPPAT